MQSFTTGNKDRVVQLLFYRHFYVVFKLFWLLEEFIGVTSFNNYACIVGWCPNHDEKKRKYIADIPQVINNPT